MEELLRRDEDEDGEEAEEETPAPPAPLAQAPVLPEPVLEPPPAAVAAPERLEAALEHSLAPGEASEPSLDAFADYEELEVVGSGGAGVVTRARERSTGQEVALKRLRKPIERERFLREADAIASLDHPAIVRLHRVLGVDRLEEDPEGPLALVLEHVAGPDLERLVQRHGRLPLLDALGLAIDLAEALGHAHERGVLHRDVKPSNVLLAPGGKAKLTDFGLALSVTAQLSLTPSGATLGTPSYMAPEQLGGAHRVDARADVYGLGATLYRLLSGVSPRGIRESRIPYEARSLVLRCVEEDPRDRYPDMEALGAALRRLRTRVQEDTSGVHRSLARASLELKHELERTLARDAGQRLLVAAAGLANLELLPAEAPVQLRTRLELGGAWREALDFVIETVEASASRQGADRPRLLRDAHAILSAALTGQGEGVRAALRRLAERAREPRRESPARRLSAVVQRLLERDALEPEDLRAISGRSGPARVVLEGVLTRIRLRAEEGSPALRAVTRARWALTELRLALPEWAERVEEEDLALALRETAVRAREARLAAETDDEEET